jgi:hypothetical protein
MTRNSFEYKAGLPVENISFTNMKRTKIKLFLFTIAWLCRYCAPAQSSRFAGSGVAEGGIIEIRSYNLKPGTKTEFHRLVTEESLPLLKKWNVDVVAYGPSIDDSDTYFLIRAFSNIPERQRREDAFYGSDDWKKGPREAILALIVNYTTIILPADFLNRFKGKINNMIDKKNEDSIRLHELNARFIRNFLRQDATTHNEIIHRDFVCIQSDGSIVSREEYMKNWSTDFDNSGYTHFTYTDEAIRIFGNMGLVRAKTVFTKKKNGQTTEGNSVYTDTYIKENGVWLCVQAQITPVKQH